MQWNVTQHLRGAKFKVVTANMHKSRKQLYGEEDSRGDLVRRDVEGREVTMVVETDICHLAFNGREDITRGGDGRMEVMMRINN